MKIFEASYTYKEENMAVLIVADNLHDAANIVQGWVDQEYDPIVNITKIEHRDFLMKGRATNVPGMALPTTLLEVA